MMRTILSGLCLVAFAGFVTAEEKKADPNVIKGKFKSWKSGSLTIMTGKKGDEKEMSFDVLDDTKVDELVGGAKKSFLAKNTFRELNEDADVTITLDGTKKISSIAVDRHNVIRGTFSSYNDGTLTLMVGKKGEEKKQTFTVPAEFKVEELVSGERKSFLAKNTFKELNEDAEVMVTMAHDNKKVANISVDRKKK